MLNRAGAQPAADKQLKILNRCGGLEVRKMRGLTKAALQRQQKREGNEFQMEPPHRGPAALPSPCLPAPCLPAPSPRCAGVSADSPPSPAAPAGQRGGGGGETQCHQVSDGGQVGRETGKITLSMWCHVRVTHADNLQLHLR